jgi:hypothetical protein
MLNKINYYLTEIKNSTFYNNVYTFFCTFLNYSFEKILYVKLNINKYYEYYLVNKDFILINVKLIYNNNNNNNLIKIDVSQYFIKNKIKILYNQLITNIINNYQIKDIKYNNDVRLLIEYKFNNNNYKVFFSYLEINQNKENYNQLNRNELILPFYSKEYIELFNKDKKITEKINYFKMNCKDIEYLKINNKIFDNKYIEEYLGPLYDFGFIYKIPIKIKWILDDLLIESFENFEFKYMCSYFDEEDEMDLVDHYIKTNDENDLLISNITNKLFRNY